MHVKLTVTAKILSQGRILLLKERDPGLGDGTYYLYLQVCRYLQVPLSVLFQPGFHTGGKGEGQVRDRGAEGGMNE